MITDEMLINVKKIVEDGLKTKGWIEEHTKAGLDGSEIAFYGNGRIHHLYLYLDIDISDECGNSDYFAELYKDYISNVVTIWIHHPDYESKSIKVYCDNYIDDYVKKVIYDTFKYY